MYLHVQSSFVNLLPIDLELGTTDVALTTWAAHLSTQDDTIHLSTANIPDTTIRGTHSIGD